MMREPQRVVGRTHNLMESHKRGLEAGGSMRSAMVLVGRPRGTHMMVKEIDTQERELGRRVKEPALHWQLIQALLVLYTPPPQMLVQDWHMRVKEIHKMVMEIHMMMLESCMSDRGKGFQQ